MISKSNVKFTDSEVRTWLVDSLHRPSKKLRTELLEDKDSENTKRSTKVAKELFYQYLKEKNIQEPHDKKELAKVLKSFYVKARKKDGEKTMYNKTIIRFGFCDIQNNSQGLG